MKNQQYLNICKELIENKLGWGPPENWKYSDFNELSKQIKDASGISISNRTLEYLFKKEDRAHNPQNATKNALAIYLGFENWHSLINNYKNVDENLIESTSLYKTPIKGKKLFKILISFLLVIGFLASYFYFFTSREFFSQKISFSVTPQIGKAPLNVFVRYNIPNVAKNFYQIFVDDQNLFTETINTTITKEKGHVAYSVPYSGYYTATLLKNSRIIDKTGFHALSDGWETYVFQKSKRFPLSNEGVIFDDSLAVEPDLPLPEEIDLSDEFFLTFVNSQEFEIDGDNLKLTAILENNERTGGLSCYDAAIELFCDNSKIRINSVSRECEEWVKLEVSESYNIGRFNDFSSLTFDHKTPMQLDVRTENNVFYVQVNKQDPVSIEYKTPLGKVKAIYVTFKGFGILHEFTLTDIQTKKETSLVPN